MLTTAGSSFRTALAVYRGESLSSLTAVAADADANGTNASRVSFHTVAGRTYRIAVNGVGGGSGSMRLRWAVSLLPPDHPDFPDIDVPAKGDPASLNVAPPPIENPVAPAVPER